MYILGILHAANEILEENHMLRSMTAYTKYQPNNQHFWEITGLNKRGFEIGFSLPQKFRFLIPKLRRMAEKKISRGKIDIRMKECYKGSQSALNTVNIEALNKFLNGLGSISFPSGTAGQVDLLALFDRFPSCGEENLLSEEETDIFYTGFEGALEIFDNERLSEGRVIGSLFEKFLIKIKNHYNEIEEKLQETKERRVTLLRNAVENLNATVNQNRFEQELFYYLQRHDLREEMDRSKYHLDVLLRLLREENATGRKIAFYLQELGREINTIASKAGNISISESTIEIRILIDEIREQSQNLV